MKPWFKILAANNFCKVTYHSPIWSAQWARRRVLKTSPWEYDRLLSHYANSPDTTMKSVIFAYPYDNQIRVTL